MALNQLNPEEIKKSGEDMLVEIGNMYASLSAIRKSISESRRFYDSDSATALRNKFETSAQNFEKFDRFLKSYAEFLKDYAGAYVGLDDEAEKTANEFANI